MKLYEIKTACHTITDITYKFRDTCKQIYKLPYLSVIPKVKTIYSMNKKKNNTYLHTKLYSSFISSENNTVFTTCLHNIPLNNMKYSKFLV